MKWALIVMVFGAPVDTGFRYDTVDKCYQAEDAMRTEYARYLNDWQKWAKDNLKGDAYKASEQMMLKRVTSGMCVPHS